MNIPQNINGQTISANSAPVVIASDNIVTVLNATGSNVIGSVKLPDIPTAGSLAALNATVATAVNSQGIVAIQITNTWVGTISFQGTEDPTGISAPSTSWFNVNGVASVTGAQVTNTTANGQFRVNSGGYTAVRVIMTVFTSGTATIWVNASMAPSMATLAEPLPSGPNIIGKVGIDQSTQGVTNAVSVTSQPELVTTGTITTTDIVVAAPSGTGTFTSGTSTAGSYVAMSASGGNASVVITVTGLTAGTIYYEGSGDSNTGIDGNWVSLNMKQAGLINTQISSSTTTNGLFRGNTAGIKYIRMRSVGTLTGTPAITLRLSAGVAGEFLFGSIPTGTNTIGTVINAPSTNTIGNVNISPSVPLTTTTAAAANADLIPAIDVSAYKSVSLQILGTWSGTLTFQGCNDNVNFVSTAAENISFTGSAVVLNTAINSLYHIPIKFRYLRVRMTSFASGSATGGAVAYTDDRQVLINNVNINSGTVLPVNGRGGSNNANSSSFLNSAATTNATSLKTAYGVVYSISAMNTTASVKFIRIYNLATAPTVGTSIPVMVIAIPASSSKEVDYALGIQFSAGIAYAITGGASATDATVVAAGDVQLAISWN